MVTRFPRPYAGPRAYEPAPLERDAGDGTIEIAIDHLSGSWIGQPIGAAESVVASGGRDGVSLELMTENGLTVWVSVAPISIYLDEPTPENAASIAGVTVCSPTACGGSAQGSVALTIEDAGSSRTISVSFEHADGDFDLRFRYLL